MEDTIERAFIYIPGIALEKYRCEISLTAEQNVGVKQKGAVCKCPHLD